MCHKQEKGPVLWHIPDFKRQNVNVMTNRKGLISLSPLILFITLYIVTSTLTGDAYEMPIMVAFIISSVYAMSISRDMTFSKRLEMFCNAAGNKNIMMMVFIFILAGAFANSAKEMGCVDATVNLTLHYLPDNMLYPGLFLTACFISLSIGTSVGTIVALTPIAAGLASHVDGNVAFVVAIIAGGAFFGDNLSFISDTTIVATSTQGCKMSDKFLVNSMTAIPVALIMLCFYFICGTEVSAPTTSNDIQYIKVLPYLVVFITAICGMNVMAILILGTVLTGFIGFADGSYTIASWMDAINKGTAGMGELIIITLTAGGLLGIIRHNGGIDYIIEKTTVHIKGKRGAELVIAALVALVNICTANNTVAILTTGDIAKTIGNRHGIDKRKCASILDTFSCCTQGLLPYGAQILLASGLAGIPGTAILRHMYYPAVLLVCSVIAIILRYPRKYS